MPPGVVDAVALALADDNDDGDDGEDGEDAVDAVVLLEHAPREATRVPAMPKAAMSRRVRIVGSVPVPPSGESR